MTDDLVMMMATDLDGSVEPVRRLFLVGQGPCTVSKD
jgi:hypothetical protein